MNRRTALALAAFLAAAPVNALSADLTATDAQKALDALDEGLRSYTHPELGEKARAAIRAGRARYLALDSRQAFAEAVSKDMVAATNDLHLRVNVSTSSARAARLTEAEEQLLAGRLAHGLLTIRRLPGNVGYLKLGHFSQDPEGATLIDSAMWMLKDTDALIIDLRENGGGGGADAQLLGHLSREPIPMVSIRWRAADGSVTTQKREPTVAAGGPLFPDRPVFVLIANRTFSAAEEFTYDLQAAKRATIVGETSRGGANPSNRPVRLGAGMSAFVPNGLVTHPTTGANWEGVGIKPDVPTPPKEALTEAYRRALAVAKPTVSTPKSEKELADARADPCAALDEAL